MKTLFFINKKENKTQKEENNNIKMLSEVAGQDITYFGKENIIGNPNDSFHHPTFLIQRKNIYQSQIQLNSLMGNV